MAFPNKEVHLMSYITKIAAALILILMLAGSAISDPDLLRIGTSGALATTAPAGDEKASRERLQEFIKSETGMANEVIRQENWRELAEKMSSGKLHLGVFHGYEFAWA